MRLHSVTDLTPSGGGGEAFNLSFSGGTRIADEKTYMLSSPRLGRFPMFLSLPGSNGLVRATVSHEARRH